MKRKGFTLVELAVVLVVIGLLVGGVVGGRQLIKQSKMKRQTNDMEGLVAACELYYDRVGALPGDPNGDGQFNNNNKVWNDLEAENLADRDRTSPYGGVYYFNYGWFGGLEGNYVSIDIPGDVGEYMDRKIDDGDPWQGVVRCEEGYWSTGKVEVVSFVFVD
jgi:prepilin-type N-terminal cleavage/methylation domain-containing protein